MQTLSQAYISDRAGISIVDFLADETGLSKSKIKQVMKIGGVWRKQKEGEPERIHRFSEKLRLDDEVHIYFDEEIFKVPPARLIEVAHFEAFAIYEKGDDFLNEASLFCDHLSLERALERDLPPELPIHLVLSDEPNVFGLILVCFSKVVALKVSEQVQNDAVTANLSFYCAGSNINAIKQIIHGARFEEVGERYLCRCASPIRLLSVYVDRLQDILSLSEKRPFVCCESLAFICPVTNKAVSFQLKR